MKLITCITFIWAFTLPLSAQLLDNFDDGNLTESPSWSGDIDSFTINEDKMLQLNAQDGGTSAIFTDLDFPDSIIWRFDVRTDFIPSSSNLFRVILAADHTDVSTMTGYVIEAGENGSPDPLCFYALDKGQMNLLACSEGLFEEHVDHTFQLTYTANGNWLVQSKQASESWRDILALNEPIQPDSFSHFGLQCTYTKSRANHFFYDNISIDRIRPDTTPPQLIAHQIKNDSVICLYFDEGLAPLTGISAIKFKPDRQIEHIHKINNSVLEIKLSEPVISAQPYEVLLDGIRDLHNNELRDTSISILYWNSRPPVPGEIIITEVLPDPDPVIGLPNIEYIELYNRTPSPINTADMDFTINDRSIPLPPTVIPPFTFSLITDTYTPWHSDENVMEMIAPISPLKNGSGSITLSHEHQVIHSMTYNEDIYTSSGKAPDGRSIEIVDLNNPCRVRNNWMASSDLSGGTPGKHKEMNTNNTQTNLNAEYYYSHPDRKSIEFHFGLLLSHDTTLDISIRPEVTIDSVFSKRSSVVITFEKPLQPDTDYLVQIEGLRDCTSFPVPLIEMNCVTPPESTPRQICINEILFDPESGCPGFIEILNYSGMSANTDDLALTGSFGTIRFELKRTLQPDGIAAFTSAPLTLENFYPITEPTQCHSHKLKSFDRHSDMLILHTSDGKALDTAYYSRDMHHPALKETTGVSLERISPLLGGTYADSWQSASEPVGWATPGYMNSQSSAMPTPSEGFFTIENEIFSPDGDGFEDELIVHFNTQASGQVVKAFIADLAGQMVRSLSGHTLIGSSTILAWDGADQIGTIRPPGPYLLMIEIIGADGRSDFFREAVVLAGGL